MAQESRGTREPGQSTKRRSSVSRQSPWLIERPRGSCAICFLSRGELVEVSFVDDLSGELTDFYHRLCLLETAVEDKLLRVGGLVLD